MNIKTGILLLAGLALGMSACHKEWMKGIGEQEETCSVSLALRPDYTVDEVVLTRSVESPADGDFNIRLENTRAEVLREWKYAELPRMIKVVPGSYKLVAYYGNDALLPAFDAPYYYGETKVTLKDGDNLDTIVRTAVATVKVALTFDESFDFDYDDYFVEVKTVGDSLHFAKDEKREGYFLPGNLRMRFGLKPIGQEAYYEFYPPVIKAVKASEFYRMTLKAQSENGALSKISIVTDSTTVDIPVDVKLPTFFLPKAAPKVTFSADVQEGEGSIATTEGIAQKAMVQVTSAAGLTELKIKTVSDTLLARGWPAELDLMKATEAQKELLKANGLTWTENIDSQDTIKSTVWLRFDNVVKLLSTAPGQTTVSAFEILAKDRFKQEGDGRFDIKVAPPVFAFVNEPGEGNVWAKRALYDVKYVSERETPVVECQGADGKWKTLETTLTEKNTDEYECLAKGLTPATAYAFRVRLGGHTLDAGNYMTETEAQVPNANMDEWVTENTRKLAKNILSGLSKTSYDAYKPNTGKWATTNTKTFDHGSDYTINSYPSVVRESKGQGYVAVVRSIGWKKGTGNDYTNICAQYSAGRLFLGSYSFDIDKNNNTEETYNYGIEFANRPMQITFSCKYDSYNNDRFKVWAVVENRENGITTRLAYGEIEAGEPTSDYVSMTLPLQYENLSKKATHFYIVFVSTNKADDDHNVESNNIKSEGLLHVVNGSYWGGSVLFIDDIELIYE